MSAEGLLRYDLPLFAGVTAADMEGLQPDYSERRFKSWQTIFNHLDDSHDVYFLRSGSLLVVYWTPEGREVIFSRFDAGTYLGELAALDGGERSLAAVARTPSSVIVLKQQSFLDIFNRIPSVRDKVVRGLVARVRNLTTRNVELAAFSVEQRVASFLTSLAMERGQLMRGGLVTNAPTHAEIAATIGANREMVSRTVTKLCRRGAIRSGRQRIEIIDPDILSAGL